MPVRYGGVRCGDEQAMRLVCYATLHANPRALGDGVAMRVAARYWVVGESSATPLWSAGVALDAFSGVERNVTRDDDADDDAADAANRTAVVEIALWRLRPGVDYALELYAAREQVQRRAGGGGGAVELVANATFRSATTGIAFLDSFSKIAEVESYDDAPPAFGVLMFAVSTKKFGGLVSVDNAGCVFSPRAITRWLARSLAKNT